MDRNKKSKWLVDFLRRSPRAAATPDIPQPPSPGTGDIPAPGFQPLEQHHEQEFVEGMNIGLDHQERAFIIHEGELATYERKPKLVAGCGCIVERIGGPEDAKSDIKDKSDAHQSAKQATLEVIPRDPEQHKQVLDSGLSIEDALKVLEERQQPQKFIAGICVFCSQEAVELAKKKELPLEQVDLFSSYCNFCKRTCSGCNRNTCKRHNLKFENPDGTVSYLCPECQVNAGREKLVHRIFQAGALLFMEQKPQLPPQRSQDESQA